MELVNLCFKLLPGPGCTRCPAVTARTGQLLQELHFPTGEVQDDADSAMFNLEWNSPEKPALSWIRGNSTAYVVQAHSECFTLPSFLAAPVDFTDY